MNYSNCNKMPGIIAVRWIKATELSSHLMEKFVAGLPIAIGTPGTELELVDAASASSLASVEKNGLVCKAELEFKTVDTVPRDEDIAWAVQDADENWWLIGTRERNYPTVEISTSAGTPGGDPAVSTVKVSHTAKIALLPVAR